MTSPWTAHIKPRYGVLVGLFILCLAYVYWPERSQSKARQSLLEGIPKVVGEWKTTKEHLIPEGQLRSLGAAEYVLRTYSRGKDSVLLYAAFFTSKHGTLTHNPEKCYPATGYTITQKSIIEVSDPGGGTFRAVSVVPVRDFDRSAVLYWFQEGDEVIADKWKHVARVLTRTLVYNRTESLMVRLSTDCPTEDRVAERTGLLKDFAGLVRTEIAKALESPTAP